MKAAVILVFLALASATYLDLSETGLRTAFVDFVMKYNRHYATAEEFDSRYQIFVENMKDSERLMQLNNGKASFGVGPYIDLSKEEFAATHLMKGYERKAIPAPEFRVVKSNLTRFGFPQGPDPTNWDWSQAGVTTPIYNQGQCGSCWAFSATETIESWFTLGGGTLTQLSMEQIVDCDTAGSDQGCNGGYPYGAYEYVESAPGLDTFQNYPYTAGNGQAGSCQFPQGNTVATVSSYSSVSGEAALYSTCSQSGPVSVCVDASSWQNYNGGVLSTCGDQIDHCVQLTGYNNYGQAGAAWNVRNSWGAGWGESGYIQLAIGSDLCGIGDQATVVVATAGK